MEDNIRAPLPNQRLNLADPYNGESIEQYIQRINSDNTIDNDMKDILIQSRREFLGLDKPIGQVDMSFMDNQIIVRATKVSKVAELFKTNQRLKQILCDKLDKFVNLTIDLMKLEPNEYIYVFEIINTNTFDSENYTYLKSIIVPYDQRVLEEYIQVIESSKREQEKQDNIRKEVESRNEKFKVFNQYIMRLKLDPYVSSLSNDIYPSVQRYLNLETNFVELDSELKNKITKFISSTRIKPEHINIINGLFNI
jgi:hypothetical protein